jgi:molecular chaperone GrpE
LKKYFNKIFNMTEQQEPLVTEDLDINEEVLNQTEGKTVPETQNDSNDTDELAVMKDKYLRLMAEFENFKRRSSKERIELIGTASREMIVSMLPILDDFERAEKNGGLSEGISLIHSKLHNTLSQKGLKAMESNGADFDAEQHEAITEVPMGDALKGKVIDTVEKGYLLNEKIIRYAKVVVGA